MVECYNEMFGLDVHSRVSQIIISLQMLGPAFIVTALVVWRIPREEKMLAKEFKENWTKYSKKTRKLIPFIW